MYVHICPLTCSCFNTGSTIYNWLLMYGIRVRASTRTATRKRGQSANYKMRNTNSRLTLVISKQTNINTISFWVSSSKLNINNS